MDSRQIHRRSPLLAALLVIAGCSAVPNMDHGSAGCQNTRGIGPRGGDVAIAPLLIGKPPAQAASIAAAQGHNVVFNVQIPGYGECWCVPPPEGRVATAWWGQHGALWLGVEDVDVGHTAADQPAHGWGC